MSNVLRAEQYLRRYDMVEGWQVGITSYRLGDMFYCSIESVGAGANIARSEGTDRDQAEERALSKARERLARTRVHS
jgi:hypothetical protein